MTLAYRISGFNRKRKYQLFRRIFQPDQYTTIIDVGYSENEYSETDNYLEKHYPYPQNITALGIDTPKKYLERYPRIRVVKYDGKYFPFRDKEFDICWSNAVLEHVGDREAQIFFLREIKRVAKAAFITTPNRHFPIEIHTRTPLLHYLPKSVFDKYLTFVKKGWAAGNYMHLLSLEELKKILRDAGIKKYTIMKNKILVFTLDFVVHFIDLEKAESLEFKAGGIE